MRTLILTAVATLFLASALIATSADAFYWSGPVSTGGSYVSGGYTINDGVKNYQPGTNQTRPKARPSNRRR